jgi:hypothetical protein
VLAVPCLCWDLKALWSIFLGLTIRPSHGIDVRYGFVDASGLGFDGSITFPGGISYQVGVS